MYTIIHIYICVQIYMYICIYIYMYIYLLPYACVCVYIHIHLYPYICMYMYVCIYIHRYTHTLCTYTHTLCTYIYMYIHTQSQIIMTTFFTANRVRGPCTNSKRVCSLSMMAKTCVCERKGENEMQREREVEREGE